MPPAPTDPVLSSLVDRAAEALARIDPLGVQLRGGPPAALPSADLAAHEADRAVLTGLLRDFEAVAPLGGDDEVDRMALVHGLRRVIPAGGPRAPVGVVGLERHLLALATRLATAPGEAAEPLAALLESVPAHLLAAREGTLGHGLAAGEVELAAAKRLPLLLDLLAAAARALPVPSPLRARIEAALGQALAAAAEHGGWVLKEYLPAAAPLGPETLLATARPLELGLGMTLDELEAEAEDLLAAQAVAAIDAAGGDDQPAGEGTRRRGLEEVAEAWGRLDVELRSWCPMPGLGVAVEESAAWLRPLLPPLAVVDPGILSSAPLRLLVDPALEMDDADLDGQLRRLWTHDVAPAVWQRAGGWRARLLLPSPDRLDGWRALARSSAPGLARWRPADTRKELAWRAILALVALGLARGRMELEEAAGLVTAETGIEPDRARLQAAHVAARPVAALSFIAGRGAVLGLVPATASKAEQLAARGALLAAGPIPAAGYTP